MGNTSMIGFTIQDGGIGMSETQLDDLFQEFEQVTDDDHRSLTADTPGAGGKEPLGLGLAVVARYVRNLNGQIRVRSELGKGTTFGIELPFEHAPIAVKQLQGLPSTLEGLDESSILSGAATARTDRLPVSRRKSRAEGPRSSIDTLAVSSEPQHSVHPTDAESLVTSIIEQRPSPSTRKTSSTLQKETMTVLVAEDNPINARLLTKRLQKLGHEVETTYDGQQCHDYFALKPQEVDVILMDLQVRFVAKAINRY